MAFLCRILIQRQNSILYWTLTLLRHYGRHPYKGTNLKKEVKSQSATEFAEEMSKIWEETAAALHLASEQMKTY